MLDEAHLLGKDMLEELRFLLNHEFDSSSPMSLVLVGQTDCHISQPPDRIFYLRRRVQPVHWDVPGKRRMLHFKKAFIHLHAPPFRIPQRTGLSPSAGGLPCIFSQGRPVEELNHRWKVFLEQEYQKEAHAGIREYYESYGVEVPLYTGLRCPDTHSQIFLPLKLPYGTYLPRSPGLIFIDVSVVAEAFQHRETRRIDGAGCFSFEGSRYEASAALANLQAEIAYDPMDTDR